MSLVLSGLITLQPVSFFETQTQADLLLSWEFAAVFGFLGATAIALHRTAIQSYVMFLATAAFFLGGRLVVHSLGYSEPVFVEHHFGPIRLTTTEAVQLVSIVAACFLAIHAGYMGMWAVSSDDPRDRSPPPPSAFARTLAFPAAILLGAAVPLAIVATTSSYRALWGGEYLALYRSSQEFATRLMPLANYALLLAFGLAVASASRLMQILATVALGLFCLGYLGLGVRSAFLSFTLLSVWLFHKRVMRLNSLMLVVLPIVLIVIAQTVWAFSVRGGNTDADMQSKFAELNKAVTTKELQRFMHNQGVSLLSVWVAYKTTDYPAAAYVQAFVPGFGAAAAISGHRIGIEDLYFPVYMAAQSLPENYRNGETMGWSIVSDALVFSDKNRGAFILLSAAFGAAFAWLIALAQQNAIWFGALALVFPKLMLLPRAGIYSIIPYLEVFFLLVGAWYLLTKVVAPAIAGRRGTSQTETRRCADIAAREPATSPRTP